MSKERTVGQVQIHKESAISAISDRMQNMIDSGYSDDLKRADLLSYWLQDYSKYLKQERTFDPTYLINYHKGDIIKVNLGYNIGSEEGGLHFGIVMDVKNAKSNKTITIIPLTSQKPDKKPHRDNVLIGTEIFRSIISKHDKLQKAISEELTELTQIIHPTSPNEYADLTSEEINELEGRINVLYQKEKELESLKNNVLKMKKGSIALVNQITTISKMRIYDPIYTHNVLYGIRLSDATISEIDKKVCNLFILPQ